MAEFSDVLTAVGKVIAQFSSVPVRIPNMRNGRCFPASYGLATSSGREIEEQARATRNEMGTPRTQTGKLDERRHDEELARSKEVAEMMASKLQGVPGAGATVRRLLDGHVIEEADLPLITMAVGFCLRIVTCDSLSTPFMEFDGGATQIFTFAISSKDHKDVCHWDPVVMVPPSAFIIACKGYNAACQSPTPGENPQNCELIWRRRLRKRVVQQGKRIEEQGRRIAQLEEQVQQLRGARDRPEPRQRTAIRKRPVGGGFQEFAKRFKEANARDLRGLSASKASGIIGKAWAEVPETDKAPFRASYEEKLAAWRTTLPRDVD